MSTGAKVVSVPPGRTLLQVRFTVLDAHLLEEL
jgi:hypothetical protein